MLRAHPRRRRGQHRRDQVQPLGWSGGVVQTRMCRAKQQLAPAAGPAPGRSAPPKKTTAEAAHPALAILSTQRASAGPYRAARHGRPHRAMHPQRKN